MISLEHLPNSIPNEKIVYFLRRHPITLFNLFVGYFFILAIPLAGAWYLNQFRPDLLQYPILMPLLVMGGSIFFLFAWLFLFQAFLDYYLDMWIVTTRRILNIEQRGLFSRTVSELRLYRVQDATANVTGFVHTMLDFGDVEIQTAAEHDRFLFEDVKHPTQIEKTILELSEADRKEHLDEAVEEFGMTEKKPR